MQKVVSKDQNHKRSRLSTTPGHPSSQARQTPYSDRISVGRARNYDVVLRNPSVSSFCTRIRREQRQLDAHRPELAQRNPDRWGAGVAVAAGGAASAGWVTFGGMVVRVVDAAQLYILISSLG